MDKRLSRRLDKIEKKLEPDKVECFRFPDGEGRFIEIPGYRTLIDALARAGIGRHREEMDETERN